MVKHKNVVFWQHTHTLKPFSPLISLHPFFHRTYKHWTVFKWTIKPRVYLNRCMKASDASLLKMSAALNHLKKETYLFRLDFIVCMVSLRGNFNELLQLCSPPCLYRQAFLLNMTCQYRSRRKKKALMFLRA